MCEFGDLGARSTPKLAFTSYFKIRLFTYNVWQVNSKTQMPFIHDDRLSRSLLLLLLLLLPCFVDLIVRNSRHSSRKSRKNGWKDEAIQLMPCSCQTFYWRRRVVVRVALLGLTFLHISTLYSHHFSISEMPIVPSKVCLRLAIPSDALQVNARDSNTKLRQTAAAENSIL